MKKKILLVLAALAMAFVFLALPRLPRQDAPAKSGPPAEAAGAPVVSPSPAQTGLADPGLPQPPAADYTGLLQIDELMVKNKASLPDAQEAFSDWVELSNASAEPVPLEGWALSDREDERRWRFSEGTLEAGERLVLSFDGVSGPAFSLSEGETLYLFSPDGQVQDLVFCSSDRPDRSLCRQEDGSFRETAWISPGWPNGPAGFAAWCDSRVPAALAIWEVAVYNKDYIPAGMKEPCDWVELRNCSDAPLQLSGYTLSDKADEPGWSLPERELAPGEILLVCCHNDEKDGSIGRALNAGFSLDATEERLYLRDASGALVDWLSLHEIPVGGSFGRMEGQAGTFYFAEPSPDTPNGEGARRVAAMPVALAPDGVFDDVGAVHVELSGDGEIHYTLDGTVPTAASPVYTEPFAVGQTTLVRAISLEEDALPSRTLTLSYIINEHHTLPVLSMAVDDLGRFQTMYQNGYKVWRVPGHIALYDGEHSFSRDCDVTLKGWTSLELPKKSFGVEFKGCYGGDLIGDVFGTGEDRYANLAIRGGQDFSFSLFRNELMQDLCLEASESCLTQQSKFCILYVDGKYYGIYALKEELDRQFYASHAGVSKDSVQSETLPVDMLSDFQTRVVDRSWREDFSNEQVYQEICAELDIDSLIDWFLLENFTANPDIQGNVRIYRSPENGNKWSFCFFDLDWAFYYPDNNCGSIIEDKGNAGAQMPPLMRALIRNSEFRDKTLRRFAELNRTVLSNEHVLEKIDYYQALLEPEVARDRQRWGIEVDLWYTRVDELRSFVIDNDWEIYCIDQLCHYLNVSAAERAEIFGR
ncbi:MAG: CotH kinase family protein [Oscillospiraceae bacterium]|nr:CotH kinase family protein [Oscillospiraceae bacterium]